MTVKWKYSLPDGSIGILTIERVAVRFRGVTFSRSKPDRHIDVKNEMRKYLDFYGPHEEGFIDNLGNYLTREEAFELAKANGQLKMTRVYPENCALYSEDIW